MKFLNDIAGSGLNVFGAGGNGTTKQLEELGLLAPGSKEKAQSQSLMRGLLGSVVAYAAQPKNQGFGSGIPYIAKGLQQGMIEAQKPFDNLNQTAMQNQKIKAYKDEQTAKDNYKQFGQELGARKHNDTYTTTTPDTLNPNLTDQDGNQIAPSIMDSSYNPQGSEKDIAFFNKQKYLDRKLADGTITLEQYKANLDPAADYMAVGDRVFNKTTGEYVDGAGMSEGEKALDKAYAKSRLHWIEKGRASFGKMELELNEALNALENEENITGPVVGSILNTTGGEITHARAAEVRDYVLTTVQKSLRETLGAQFTEVEGKMLMDRAYNPLLSQAENAKRVRRLLGEIKEAAQAKESMSQYWSENNGSLVGYRGPSVRSALKLPENPDYTQVAPEGGGATINADGFELIED